jgi:hypothetical protein
VNDIHEIRAKLQGGTEPSSPRAGRFGFGLLVLAGCAIGFGAVLLVPRLQSLLGPQPALIPLQPSAAKGRSGIARRAISA